MTSVFEEKNISKAIMRVGLPAMLGQLTTLIYNIADTFFVSLTRKPATIAAVTLCAPILLIIMSIACIFGMGGSSVIARLLGEEKKEESGATMNFCVYAMGFTGIITLVLGLLFLQPLAKISGADAENMAYTCDYLKWIFIGAPFIMLANGFVHLFRSVGLIKEGTIGLVYRIVHISQNDLPEFPSAALSSVNDATASPPSSALQTENSSGVILLKVNDTAH